MNTPDYRDSSTRLLEFRCILLVKDLAATRSFYESVFAWPIINDWGGGILYDTGAATLELIQDDNAGVPNNSSCIAVAVLDVWTLFERVKDNVPIVFPVRHNAWGDTSFRMRDVNGFEITVFTKDKV